MQLFLVFSIFLPLVLCDTIKINSPTQNQVINNSSFLIDYLVERNDNNSKLFFTNTTTELLDARGNSLVSFGKNLTNSTMVRLDMRTFVQPNTVTNFTVKIIAFGEYDTPINGNRFGELEFEVPLQLNLNNTTTSRPTTTNTTTSSRPTTTSSSTATLSSTSSPSPTSTPTSKSDATVLSKSTMFISLASIFGLFLI